MKFAM